LRNTEQDRTAQHSCHLENNRITFKSLIMRKTLLLLILLISMALPSLASINGNKVIKTSLGLTKDTVVVSTVDSLKLAISGATKDRLILLRQCSDAVGYYKMGATGITYPAMFLNLELKNYPGDVAKVYGSFGSTGSPRMKIKAMTFNGLTFKGDLTDLAENNQCFYLQANDSLMNGLYYNNCTFQDLGGAATGPRIFYAKSSTNAILNALVYDGCTFKNYGGAVLDGATGQHFLQQNDAKYKCDSIVLKNSIISDWHGSQFFNIGRSSTGNKDSLFTLIIENNTFVRFGGNATTLRNFVECTKSFGGGDVSITIKNNLFYKRWGKNKAVAQLALFTPIAGQDLKVNVLNNYFDPDTIVVNLPVSAGVPTLYNHVELTKTSLGMLSIPTFVNDSLLIMSRKSKLYTAGTNGVCVGAPSLYTSDDVQVAVKNAMILSKLTAYSNGDLIYVTGSTKPVTVYNLMGQNLGTYSAEAVERGVDIHMKGLVFVSTSEGVVKIMVK